MNLDRYLKSPDERQEDVESQRGQSHIKRIGKFVLKAIAIFTVGEGVAILAHEDKSTALVALGTLGVVAVAGVIHNRDNHDTESNN